MLILPRKAAKPTELKLAVRPDARRFSTIALSPQEKPTGEQGLVQELERSFKHTMLKSLVSPTELMVDKDCLVQGTFRYSTSALSCLGRLLGCGLAQTIFDLGGVDRPGSPSRPVDIELASRLLNDAIKLRFAAKLKGRQLVLDRQLQQIDGLVGSRYELYHNLELYENANDMLSKGAAPVKFHEAILCGRRMALRYRTNDPLFEVTSTRATGEPFFGGYHLGNSEVGDCSVRAAVVIIRQWCDNKALAEFAEGGRVKHIRSKKFEKRLHQLLVHVQMKAGEATTLKKHVLRLMGQPLGLGHDEERHAGRSKFVTKRLEQLGLSSQLANRVMDRTLAEGSYDADRFVVGSLRNHELLEKYAQRTEYDLFNAITFVAKTLSVESQERLEQLGYKFLLGKHSLAQHKELP